MTENATGNATGTPADPPPEGPDDLTSPGWNTDNLKDYRRFRRSRTDRKVAGVAGGLGAHLNVDPTVVRVLFVVLAFFGGAGILAYGALWLLVPEEGTEEAVIPTSESARNGLLIAVAVVAGLLALGDTWNGFSFPWFWFPWPLAIIALVVAVVLLSKDSGTKPPYQGPTHPGPTYQGLSYQGPTYQGPTHPGPTPSVPPHVAHPGGQQLGPQGGAPWYPPPPPPVPPRPRRRGPVLFGITVALAAVALGVLGLYDASGADVRDAAYPALALGVIGLMLLLGAFWGRPGGLIALGLVTSLVLAAFSIGNPTFDGDRDVRIAPERAADVEDAYDVPAGRIVLDLSRVEDPEELDGRRIDLEANAGEIVVIVPEDVAVDFNASVHYGGTIETPVGTRDGWSSDLKGHLGDDDAVAVVDLELDLQFGRIAVNQL